MINREGTDTLADGHLQLLDCIDLGPDSVTTLVECLIEINQVVHCFNLYVVPVCFLFCSVFSSYLLFSLIFIKGLATDLNRENTADRSSSNEEHVNVSGQPCRQGSTFEHNADHYGPRPMLPPSGPEISK